MYCTGDLDNLHTKYGNLYEIRYALYVVVCSQRLLIGSWASRRVLKRQVSATLGKFSYIYLLEQCSIPIEGPMRMVQYLLIQSNLSRLMLKLS